MARPATKKFSEKEIKVLLQVVHECNPRDTSDWESVTTRYNNLVSSHLPAREKDSLKRKFTKLSCVRYSQGPNSKRVKELDSCIMPNEDKLLEKYNKDETGRLYSNSKKSQLEDTKAFMKRRVVSYTTLHDKNKGIAKAVPQNEKLYRGETPYMVHEDLQKIESTTKQDGETFPESINLKSRNNERNSSHSVRIEEESTSSDETASLCSISESGMPSSLHLEPHQIEDDNHPTETGMINTSQIPLDSDLSIENALYLMLMQTKKQFSMERKLRRDELELRRRELEERRLEREQEKELALFKRKEDSKITQQLFELVAGIVSSTTRKT